MTLCPSSRACDISELFAARRRPRAKISNSVTTPKPTMVKATTTSSKVKPRFLPQRLLLKLISYGSPPPRRDRKGRQDAPCKTRRSLLPRPRPLRPERCHWEKKQIFVPVPPPVPRRRSQRI